MARGAITIFRSTPVIAAAQRGDQMPCQSRLLLPLVLAASFSGPASAGLQDALDALRKGDYAAAPAAQAPDKCFATGSMEGEKFAAAHCAVALYGDQHSVAIWFSEDAISPEESQAFQISSYVGEAKAGKQRTQVQIMFCPGGGSATASAAAVKSIDLNTNHAKSPLAGVQWVVESPRDFKLETLAGEVKPGGRLTGKIVGARGKTAWTLDFDVALPAKDAAAGMSCGK